MAKDGNNQFRSRSGQRAKRRKTNLILNSLIVIVIVLIIIVAASIFLGGGKEDKKDTATKNRQVQSTSNNNNNKKSENESTVSDDSNQNTDVENENEQDENEVDEDEASIDEEEGIDSAETLAEEGSEPNVKKTYTNPNWNPVGTEQTEGHQYSSDQGSKDWNEKEKAISYATGISQDDLTVWYLERGSSDSEAIGTVTPKDQSKTYRVYLSWTDGQGWMPTKVEELKVNDKK